MCGDLDCGKRDTPPPPPLGSPPLPPSTGRCSASRRHNDTRLSCTFPPSSALPAVSTAAKQESSEIEMEMATLVVLARW